MRLIGQWPFADQPKHEFLSTCVGAQPYRHVLSLYRSPWKRQNGEPASLQYAVDLIMKEASAGSSGPDGWPFLIPAN